MRIVLNSILAIIIIAAFFLIPADSVSALTLSPAGEYDLQIVTDGMGGQYIAWSRDWHPSPIKIQHLNREGVPLWKEPVTIPGDTTKFKITYDGLGGIIIACEKEFSTGSASVYKLLVQRIDANRNIKWTEPGTVLVQNGRENAEKLIQDLNILPDQTGGAYIVWKPFTENRIIAQRISHNGEKLWGEEGVEITRSYVKLGPVCIEDNEGGFIIAWLNWKNPDSVLIMQRYNREGINQWANDGITIEEYYNSINIISDGENGAYIALANIQNASLMRINGSGEMTWGRQQIASVKGYISDVCMLLDNYSGRLYLSWAEAESNYINTYYQALYIFAQYYTPKGVPAWGDGPTQVAEFVGTKPILQITGDGDSGTILVWKTIRNNEYHVTAQRLDQSGKILWGENGKDIKKLYRMVRDFTIYPDINGAMLFTQEGGYAEPNLYLHFINSSGEVKEAEMSFYPVGEPKITEDYDMNINLFGIQEPEWWELILPLVIILIGGGLILAVLGPTAIWRRINNRKKLTVHGDIHK